MQQDRRQVPRQRTQLSARVMIDSSLRVCVISDISEMGARLELGTSITLPTNFILDMTQNGSVLRMCELRHRTGGSAGVRFVPTPPAKLRQQFAKAGSGPVRLERVVVE
jgi:hypothetical protein